jgi:hypothetical protein
MSLAFATVRILVDTFQAIAVTGLAVLPGALYTWSFEREVGNWGVSLSDRLLRFVGFSAMFHAVFALPEYLVWSRYLHQAVDGSSRFRNLIWEGAPLPWWLVLVPIAYVGLPMLAGFVTARGATRGARWTRFLVGPNPAPRAWDQLFWPNPSLTVRARLKNEIWIGGMFGAKSYAAGYPETQDLLLEDTYAMEPDGSFSQDEAGSPVSLGSGILIGWEDIRFLEVFPHMGES